MVVAAPRRWLRVEGATLLAGSLLAFSTTGRPWWLVPVTTPAAAALVAVGWWQNASLLVALGLVWLAHIGLDRALGYGLKYNDHFQDTHLGRLGPRA